MLSVKAASKYVSTTITYRYASVKLLGPLHTELVLAGGLSVSSVTPVKSCESVVNSNDWSVLSETFKNLCTGAYV